MKKYEPPFIVTNKVLNLVSAISEKVGKIMVYRDFDSKPFLRRNNRIKSVHSSLKIEENSLSESMVRAVLDGRYVVGPEKEILEVENAFAAYEKLPNIDPFELEELKRVHGIMTKGLVSESGEFRKGGEGVFKGDRCIFIAPPADIVPTLMQQLFDWMKANKDLVHPLIMSCVFHYEFVFIHPFGDGNGRMARLWQNALLMQWQPLFQHMPIESQIEKFQDAYYDAISHCNATGDSTAFVEFMLSMIDSTLQVAIDQHKQDSGLTPQLDELLTVMEYDTPYTANSLLGKLGLKSKEALRRNYLGPAIENGYVEMSITDKPTSRNQRYIKR